MTASSSLSHRASSLEKLPCFDGMTTVEMPPDWRCEGPTPYTFVFTNAELTGEQTREYHRAMAPLTAVNPRLFTPETVAMTSLFHPAFWDAVRRGHAERRIPSLIAGARLILETSTEVARRRYYLQSLLFLTGVTLSAAIVQNRWSRGTIESKLSRLWQAGMTATTDDDLAALASLDLGATVTSLARHLERPDTAVLIELKKVFAEALGAVVDDFPTEQVTLTAPRLDSAQQERFGFVADLESVLDHNLRAVVAYGSSVTSDTFADYDLLLLVDDSQEALTRLAGASPRYRGVELNVGVYGQADFWSFQLASGDNLTDNALCLLGEVTVPRKSVADLLARNYSFAFVRLRQLLGMAVHATVAEPDDDKKNLYGYFIKIPLNIAKGTRAAVGASVAKTEIERWMDEHVGYDVPAMLRLCETGRAAEAIATASWCTQRVIAGLNQEEPAYETLPKIEARA